MVIIDGIQTEKNPQKQSRSRLRLLYLSSLPATQRITESNEKQKVLEISVGIALSEG